MICLYAESHISTSILTIYTFIRISLCNIAHTVLTILSYLFDPHQIPHIDLYQETNTITTCQLDLPVSRFEELHSSCGNIEKTNTIADDNEEKEMCSVCLMDFEKEDLVNKLPRCQHIFHVECMEKWLDRCQFTCPLCRSLVLHASFAPSKMWTLGFCILATGQDY